MQFCHQQFRPLKRTCSMITDKNSRQFLRFVNTRYLLADLFCIPACFQKKEKRMCPCWCQALNVGPSSETFRHVNYLFSRNFSRSTRQNPEKKLRIFTVSSFLCDVCRSVNPIICLWSIHVTIVLWVTSKKLPHSEACTWMALEPLFRHAYKSPT